MDLKEYVAEREARDSEFRAAREALRPQYEAHRALIAARLAAGLTQKQLAEELHTTQSSVARIESGAYLPRIDTLFRLARVLGVDFEITRQGELRVKGREAGRASR